MINNCSLLPVACSQANLGSADYQPLWVWPVNVNKSLYSNFLFSSNKNNNWHILAFIINKTNNAKEICYFITLIGLTLFNPNKVIYYCFPFTGKETEPQRGKVTSSVTYSLEVEELGYRSRPVWLQRWSPMLPVAVVLNVWSPDQQHQPLLGTC